jgi:exonuclease SbcC
MSTTELRTVAISDFRSIRGKVAIPLNAGVILLHGTNGAGKSTVMSALELTLTGSVSDFETPGTEHLVHRGARRASIELVTSGGTVDFTIEESRINGIALLDEDDRRFFDERCYLRQRTLGRLLELYENPAEGGESALTAFVNDLVGLDELDALIDGLYPVTHKSRVKRLVPEYGDLENELAGRRKRIRGWQAELRTSSVEAAEERSRLHELLTALMAPPAVVDDLDYAASWLQQGADDADRALVDLVGARREIAALTNRVKGLADRAAAHEIAVLEAASTRARAAADAWRTSHGAALEAALNELRTTLPGVPAATGPTDPAAVRATALEQLNAELDRLRAALNTDEVTRIEAQRLDKAIASAQIRLVALDEQMAASGAATAAEELGKALAALIPHVHTEDCPVCGRDYSEASREPLSARLAARVSELGSEAERLQELANARLQALADLRRLEDTRRVTAGSRMESEMKVEVQARVARLENAQRRLVELASGVAEGAAVIRKEIEASRDLTAARDRDRVSAELRLATESIAASLGRPAPTAAVPLADAIANLADQVAVDITALERQSVNRTAAAQAIQQVKRANNAQRRLDDEIKNEQAAVDRAEIAIAEVERRRSVMRKLRDEAEVARVRIVRRVFTESLNRVWRDLFVRLAPEEPFVPAFRVPVENQRVVATLETMHRDGKPGGPPAAMLSAGNLNTAALTLFLALNLSVERRLPWILLDDPVQSMDEVHVAQFAGLLRTLAREHDRRVVIAVHERALFEYLTLELSPAGTDESLITVELTRSEDGSTLAEPSFQPYVEDRAFERA